jgi:hypothetical protein
MTYESVCPACGAAITLDAPAFTLQPGNYTRCAGCSAYLAFTADMGLRAATEDEEEGLRDALAHRIPTITRSPADP